MSEIALRNVCKQFDSEHYGVKDFNLDIHDKEFVIFVGPSGCGKSTTLRIIAGLEEITDGELWIDGELSNYLEPKERGMSMVFQNYALYPNMTVYGNMAYALKIRKLPKDEIDRKVHEVAKILEIDQLLDRRPAALSGGQKQRVAIARALVLNPKILLCDEATSALDPQITKGILALLLKINKELGITIVVVTHQMEVVKEICNKVAFLKHGKMIATGKPEELFVAPNKDVQEFVGDSVEFLPKDGVNVRLFFNDETASDSAITHLAHELGINFGICQGKLENFRGTIMGSLVINVTEADRERVTAWLTDRGILWEVLENV